MSSAQSAALAFFSDSAGWVSANWILSAGRCTEKKAANNLYYRLYLVVLDQLVAISMCLNFKN